MSATTKRTYMKMLQESLIDFDKAIKNEGPAAEVLGYKGGGDIVTHKPLKGVVSVLESMYSRQREDDGYSDEDNLPAGEGPTGEHMELPNREPASLKSVTSKENGGILPNGQAPGQFHDDTIMDEDAQFESVQENENIYNELMQVLTESEETGATNQVQGFSRDEVDHVGDDETNEVEYHDNAEHDLHDMKSTGECRECRNESFLRLEALLESEDGEVFNDTESEDHVPGEEGHEDGESEEEEEHEHFGHDEDGEEEHEGLDEMMEDDEEGGEEGEDEHPLDIPANDDEEGEEEHEHFGHDEDGEEGEEETEGLEHEGLDEMMEDDEEGEEEHDIEDGDEEHDGHDLGGEEDEEGEEETEGFEHEGLEEMLEETDGGSIKPTFASNSAEAGVADIKPMNHEMLEESAVERLLREMTMYTESASLNESLDENSFDDDDIFEA